MLDFSLINGGTIVLLTPNTNAARDWVGAHVDAAAIYWGSAVVIEHRYAPAIVNGLVEAGFTIGQESAS